jgi:hypothetical protein
VQHQVHDSHTNEYPAWLPGAHTPQPLKAYFHYNNDKTWWKQADIRN